MQGRLWRKCRLKEMNCLSLDFESLKECCCSLIPRRQSSKAAIVLLCVSLSGSFLNALRDSSLRRLGTIVIPIRTTKTGRRFWRSSGCFTTPSWDTGRTSCRPRSSWWTKWSAPWPTFDRASTDVRLVQKTIEAATDLKAPDFCPLLFV